VESDLYIHIQTFARSVNSGKLVAEQVNG